MSNKRNFIKAALLAAVPLSVASKVMAATPEDPGQSKILAILLAKLEQLKNLATLDGKPGLYKAGRAPGSVSGTKIEKGFVGEVTTPDLPLAQTTTSTITKWMDVTNSSLTLAPGVWQIFYSTTAVANSGSNPGNYADVIVRIFNASDAAAVPATERFLRAYCQNGNEYAASTVGCLAASTIVHLASPKAFTLQFILNINNGKGASGGVLVSPGTMDSTFHAVRIG